MQVGEKIRTDFNLNLIKEEARGLHQYSFEVSVPVVIQRYASFLVYTFQNTGDNWLELPWIIPCSQGFPNQATEGCYDRR